MRAVAVAAPRQVSAERGHPDAAFAGPCYRTLRIIAAILADKCRQFKFDDFNFDDSLKDSRLGRTLLLMSRHPKETAENRRTAEQLICATLSFVCADADQCECR